MSWSLNASNNKRLSGRYDLDTITEEVQALSGQLDPELVPLESLYEHIDLCTLDIASLLNQILNPWYGCYVSIGDLTSAWSATGNGYLTEVTLSGSGTPTIDTITVNGYGGSTTTVKFEKILALRNGVTGSSRKARDWSQFSGISYGSNSQMADSLVWMPFGNSIHIWCGSTLYTSATMAGDNKIGILGLRQPAPIGSSSGTVTSEYIDLPDKYVPLVISKTILWALKQARMGNWKELETNINQQVLQIQRDNERFTQSQIARQKLDGFEV